MVTLKKFRIFCYLDSLTSISQLLITTGSTVLWLYFHFKTKKRDGGGGGDGGISFFSSAFKLIFGVLVLYTQVGQCFAVRKLLRAVNSGLFDEELDEVRSHWGWWNFGNCVVSLIWYPLFAATMFYEYGWPLPYIGICFLVIAGARVTLTCVFYYVLDEEPDDPNPQIAMRVMGPPVDEMREIRHSGWI